MKRTYLVVLIAQSVVIVLMLMYAFVQKAQADTLLRMAEQAQHDAQLQRAQMINQRDSIRHEQVKFMKMLEECEARNTK